MGDSDRVREYVLGKYIRPAIAAGEKCVKIRTGDIHQAMGFRSKMPTVCSALEGKRFLEMAGVRIIDREGPHRGG